MPYAMQLVRLRTFTESQRRALLALHQAGALDRQRHEWRAADQAVSAAAIDTLHAHGLVKIRRLDRVGRRARAQLTAAGEHVAAVLERLTNEGNAQ